MYQHGHGGMRGSLNQTRVDRGEVTCYCYPFIPLLILGWLDLVVGLVQLVLLTVGELVSSLIYSDYSKISLLRKIRHYLPLDTRKLFFNYYIKPHLSYCSSIWGQTSKENHNRIIKLQKQAARLILNKDYTSPSTEPFNE